MKTHTKQVLALVLIDGNRLPPIAPAQGMQRGNESPFAEDSVRKNAMYTPAGADC